MNYFSYSLVLRSNLVSKLLEPALNYLCRNRMKPVALNPFMFSKLKMQLKKFVLNVYLNKNKLII